MSTPQAQQIADIVNRVLGVTDTERELMQSYKSSEYDKVQWREFSATAYDFVLERTSKTTHLTIKPNYDRERTIFTANDWFLFVDDLRAAASQLLRQNFMSKGVQYFVVRGKPAYRRYWLINLYDQPYP